MTSISKERLKAIKAIRDADIDYSDIPALDEDFFQQSELVIFNQIDPKVLSWFQERYGNGYRSKISAVLQAFMETHP